MKVQIRSSLLSLVLQASIAALLFGSPAFAADGNAKQNYEARLASVQSLTGVLSKEVGKPGVQDALGQVDAKSKEASGLAAVGEYEVALAILDQGYHSLTAALAKVKGSTSPAATPIATVADSAAGDKTRRDGVTRKIASTRSLLEPLKKQNVGKDAAKAAEISAIEADLQKSDGLLASGKLVEADKLIDEAYGRAKKAITSAQTDAGQRDLGKLSADDRKSAIEARLKSATALRDALKRRGVAADVVNRAEQLTSEAARLVGTDATRALGLADQAYDLLKAAMLKSTNGG